MRGPETIYAWRYPGSHHEGQWNRAKLSYAEAEYTRADIADAAVAAAYEAAAKYHDKFLMTRTGVDVEKVVASTEAIRALTTADAKAALEAVRREARAEAFNTALMEIEGHLPEFGAGDPQDGTDLIIDQTWRSFRKIVLALIDKETTE